MKKASYKKNVLDQLHDVEIEILDEIVRVCEKNNIEYFLVGGTLLGAVRHQGFIPWDDDIDIGMTRKNYNKFIECAQRDLKEQYFLDYQGTDETYYLPFIKNKKNNTLIDEAYSHHLNNHKGIFVDIFPFDNSGGEKSLSLWVRAILIRSISDTILVKEKFINYNKARHKYIVKFFNLFSKKFLFKLQKFLSELNKNENSKYLCCIVGTQKYRKNICSRESMFPLKKVLFNGKYYYGFNNNDEYLSRTYGDYMTLPPVEDRVNHCAYKVIFDLKGGKK